MGQTAEYQWQNDTYETPRALHFATFDPLLDKRIGYSLMTVFEHHSPGAWESAVCWAVQHCLMTEVVKLDGPAQHVLNVRPPSGGVLSVHRNVH